MRPAHTAEAVKAARRCGVCGISTAVLEVTQTDPPDQRTLEHFCTLTGRLVFEDQQLLEVHSIPADTKILVAEDCTAEAFPKRCLPSKREKGKAEPNRTKLGLFGRIPAATLQLYGFCDKMTRNSKMKSAVILAAGLSSRMMDFKPLLPADLPQIDPTLLNRLSAIPAQAVYPVCHGKNGHPLLLRRSGVETVLLHDGTQGLKGALKRLDTQTIETEDLGCLLDIDNPEDYQKLLDFRAESVPTEGACQELLQFFETSERTQAHCEAVCRVAVKLADGPFRGQPGDAFYCGQNS